jgi:hypothetical protein
MAPSTSEAHRIQHMALLTLDTMLFDAYESLHRFLVVREQLVCY